MNADNETFVVHVVALEVTKMVVHSSREAQIRLLKANEAPTNIPAEYSEYVDVFLLELAAKLLEHTDMNDHTIKLEEDTQLSYGLIYSLRSVELETLKTYIKTNLKNGFIWTSISLAGAPIFFDRKPDRSFRLCVNYPGLNNLTIKNRDRLSLIGKYLDRLGWAKRFTQLDVTSACHWLSC